MKFDPFILAHLIGTVKETLARRLILPTDSGPVYKETLMGRYPVEPWNTFSNIVFLIVVIYWAVRVYPQMRQHVFLAACLPVLLIGYVGGTLYHAFRDEKVWLWMDWFPILLLCMACTILFARRAGLGWPKLVFLLTLPVALRWMMTAITGLSETVILNVEYIFIGAIVLSSVLLHMRKRRWLEKRNAVIAVSLFVIAISFRALDKHAIMAALPMGSHWLWHLFGGLAVHFLIAYVFQDDLVLSAKPSKPGRSARTVIA